MVVGDESSIGGKEIEEGGDGGRNEVHERA
jgi:hypothetical protein